MFLKRKEFLKNTSNCVYMFVLFILAVYQGSFKFSFYKSPSKKSYIFWFSTKLGEPSLAILCKPEMSISFQEFLNETFPEINFCHIWTMSRRLNEFDFSFPAFRNKRLGFLTLTWTEFFITLKALLHLGIQKILNENNSA